MKLDYKILWLDDNMKELFIDDEYDIELAKFISEKGFNPIIETVSTEEEFFSKLNDTYDLILTDYHLKEKAGETRDGDLIVKEVRDRSVFSEILFYSARGEVKDTYKLDRITFVETRKSTAREHQTALIGRVKNLIELTIKKFEHIVAIRGMIMHETSTLDSQMLEIIKTTLKNKKIDFNTLAITIYDDLIKLYSDKSKFVNECKENSNFNNLTKDTFVFSAKYKIQALGEILKNLNIEDFSEDYNEKINNVRNKFAHAVLLKDEETGREYFKFKEEGITFDKDLCKQIRIDIITHKNNLDKIEKLI